MLLIGSLMLQQNDVEKYKITSAIITKSMGMGYIITHKLEGMGMGLIEEIARKSHHQGIDHLSLKHRHNSLKVRHKFRDPRYHFILWHKFHHCQKYQVSSLLMSLFFNKIVRRS